MPAPIIHSSKLNEAFEIFKQTIERNDAAPLTHINNSQYFREHEKYKDRVVIEAQKMIASENWSSLLVGSGKILRAVISAIEVKVDGKLNNLIDWRSTVYLKELKDKPAVLKKYEGLCFELYKNRQISDKDIFEALKSIKNDYRLITYLFFISNPRQYLPLSPVNFDLVFDRMGLDFRTSQKSSWENYLQFIEYVRQVQTDLRKKLPNDDISLLDAHSYLWLLKMDIKAGRWETASPEKEAVLKCLRDFSAEYPDTAKYQNWLEDPKYLWALEWNDKLFPPKDIHARVLGKKKDEFVSGEQTTNRYFRELGFKVTPKNEAMTALLKRLETNTGIDPDQETEETGTVERRLEQALLRSRLLGNKTEAECGMCGEMVPAAMLTAAHIKRRSQCSRAEKWDLDHIAMPMCKFGCDDLYELGWVSVEAGHTIVGRTTGSSPKVRDYLKKIEGKACQYWKPQTEKYFKWHRENRFKK